MNTRLISIATVATFGLFGCSESKSDGDDGGQLGTIATASFDGTTTASDSEDGTGSDADTGIGDTTESDAPTRNGSDAETVTDAETDPDVKADGENGTDAQVQPDTKPDAETETNDAQEDSGPDGSSPPDVSSPPDTEGGDGTPDTEGEDGTPDAATGEFFALYEGDYLVTAVEISQDTCNATLAGYEGAIWPLSLNEGGFDISEYSVTHNGNQLGGESSETIDWGSLGFCDCVVTNDYVYGGEVTGDGELFWIWATTWKQTGGTDCSCVNDGVALPCSFQAVFTIEYQPDE